MKQFQTFGTISLLAATMLTGCIDKDYDLSDIDTTTEIKVKDLVLPINMDPLQLSDVISIKDDSQLQEITLNGKTFYAVNQEGSFSSDPVAIASFTADPLPLRNSQLSFVNPLGGGVAPGGEVVFGIRNAVNNTLSYNASGIDPSILSITNIQTENFTIELVFELGNTFAGTVAFKNLKLELPKGLSIADSSVGADYDPASGIYMIPSLPLTDGKASVSITISGIDLQTNGIDIDSESHTFDFNSAINIDDAQLSIVMPQGTTLPAGVDMAVKYNLSALTVKSISGLIKYELEGNGLAISPVKLNDLPDFLAGEETNLVLANPQIYLSLNNPLGNDGLSYQSGLTLTAIRDNEAARHFSLDNGFFSVGSDKGANGPYNLCLSPKNPESVPSEYEAGLSHVLFSTLGEVVSGKGLPKEIEIELIDPMIPAQEVTAFELGRELPGLEGTWRFLAPLALTSNGTNSSVIVYTDRKDGWNDEDVDAITIETLVITATVDNDLPLSADIKGYPLTVDGKRIPDVEITGATVAAGEKNKEIEIKVSGIVKHLDGIEFTATVRPGNDDVLQPSQKLTLNKIRAKVSGHWAKEL